MKYKVGDKIKIIRATNGCLGARGKIGIVTNKKNNNGLGNGREGFNVECSDGEIWRIGFESECELLDEELTAEEAIKIQAEMCRSMNSCADCPIYKEGGYRCDSFRVENPEKVVEIIKQWKKDHEKKEIETEIVYLIRVMKEEGDSDTCIYACEIDANKEKIDKKLDELTKRYCEENGGKIYAKIDYICRAKS